MDTYAIYLIFDDPLDQLLAVNGDDTAVEQAIAEIASIKGEPPLELKKRYCATCYAPPPAFTSGMAAATPKTREEMQAMAQAQKQCIFSGTAEEDLPDWFRKREPAA